MHRSVSWPSGLLALLLLLPGAALAVNTDAQIGAVAIDRTLTPMGRAVYQSFARKWREQPDATGFTVSLQEQAAPRGGTLISLEYQRRTLFQASVSQSRSDPDRIADAAVAALTRHLHQRNTAFYPELDTRDELN